MTFSTGYQSYIGVNPPQSTTVYTQNVDTSKISVSGTIEPTSIDSTADVGRPSKRFRTAYINEIDMDATGIMNGLSITTIDDGVTDRRRGTRQMINPIQVYGNESQNDGLTACIIHPTTRIMLAIGANNSGNDFRAFSTTSSIDTSDAIWTKRTINLTNMPSGVNSYNPRYLTYDPVNDAYIATNGQSTSTFYYCPASNLDAWETRNLPFSTNPNGLASFVNNGVCYTMSNNQIGNMFYTTDNVNWDFLPQSAFILPDGSPVTQTVVAWDMIERPDWQEGEFDRYILLSQKITNQNITLWTSTSPIGPFVGRYSTNPSTNVRTLLYNPYYKTIAISKTSTLHISVYQYYPNQDKTPTSLPGNSKFNLALSPTLFSFQNDSYFPDFKTHIVSMQTGNGSSLGLGSLTWDGQYNYEIANGANTTGNVNYNAGHNKWTLDKTNGSAYAAVRKGGTPTFPPTTSNYTISKMSFIFPPVLLSAPSTCVTGVVNANVEKVMVTSKRAMVDKFDRFVSLTSDKITGGVGSSQHPIKNVIMNSSVRSMGRDAFLYTKSGNQDTVLANVNFENILSNPAVLAKSVSSFGNMKNKDWTSTSSAVAAFTTAQSYNTRFIGSGSMTGLNRTFAISNNGGAMEIVSSSDGGSSWQPFSTIPSDAFKTGSVKECSDIAYSPIYNTYVVTALHNSLINGTQIGDRSTLYSNDGGATWNYCKFDVYVDQSTGYGMVRWIADWGTHGTFVLFSSVSNSTVLANIMLSEDGSNWRNVYNIPSSVPLANSSIRLFTKHDYDPSRNMLALTRQISSATSNNVTYISTDGENWSEMQNLQAINIFAKDIVISSTVTLPNSNVNFKVNTFGTEITAALTSGTYTPGALAAHVAAAMTTAYIAFSGSTASFFVGTYTSQTGKFNFKIVSDLIFAPTAATTFQFLFSTGTNAASSPRVELGFNTVDTALQETNSSTTIQYFHPTLNNNRVDFLRNGTGINRVGYLRPGNYTPTTFATEFARAINVQWVAAGNTAATCTWSSVTGFFTFATSQNIDITWLTGANNLVNCYREFGVAKVDVVNTLSMVSTVAQHHDGGILRTIAYSPTLDIWVQVGTNTGAGTVGTTSSNVWWSKELGSSATSYNWGWTPVDCFQQGVATLRPSFTDVVWCDSMQMFLLLNGNTNFAGNVANDRNLWYSSDGKTFAPITNVNSPKTILTTVGALSSNRLTWDNNSHSLFIDTPSINTATTITRYSFSALQRNEIPHMPGIQYASSTASSNNPASGSTATWTFTFPQPFTVAPTYIIYSFTNNTTALTSGFTHWISAVTTTTFTVTAGAVGAAIAASAPVIKYIAWESF